MVLAVNGKVNMIKKTCPSKRQSFSIVCLILSGPENRGVTGVAAYVPFYVAFTNIV